MADPPCRSRIWTKRSRARRSAVFAILSAINVPIIHFSVQWWKTLHQGASVLTSTGQLNVHGSMLLAMLLEEHKEVIRLRTLVEGALTDPDIHLTSPAAALPDPTSFNPVNPDQP